LKKEAKNFGSIGFGLSAEAQPESFLVLFCKKEPLALPLAFRGGDLHTCANLG
jgi:hypothetical protein